MRLSDNIRMEEAAECRRHKSHIPKIMYFAAIVMPQLKMNLDGHVYFEPLIREVKAKRNPINRKSGTAFLRTTSTGRAKFNDVIIKVLKSAVQKLPNSKRIRIIADGARGHSAGKHGQKGLDKALSDA